MQIRAGYILFLFLNLGISYISLAQMPYYRHTLKYRLYGQDARPIGDSVQYRVHIKPSTNWEKCTYKDGVITLDYGSSEEDLYDANPYPRDIQIGINHGKDSMTLLMPLYGPDSIPYTPGAYNIPGTFAPMFHANSTCGGKILYKDISSFKVPDINSAPKSDKAEYDSVLKDYEIYTWTKLYKPGTFASLGMKNYKWFLLISKNNGLTWEEKPLDVIITAPDKATQPTKRDSLAYALSTYGIYTAMVPKSDSVLYFIRQDELGDYATFEIDAKKNAISNIQSLSSLTVQAFELQFLNNTIGFVLGKSGNTTFNFYSTANGGISWQLIDKDVDWGKFAPFFCRFTDKMTGYLGYFPDNDYQGKLEFNIYQTTDGGHSWPIYSPPIKTFDAQTDKLVEKLGVRNNYFYVTSTDGKLYKVQTCFDLNYTSYNQLTMITRLNNEVWALYSTQYMFYTKDNGKTWKFVPFKYYAMHAELIDPTTLLLYSGYRKMHRMKLKD